MSSVAMIRKSPAVVVRPPEAAPSVVTITKLTCFDKVFVKAPFTVLLVFENSWPDAMESTKRALSQALAHYYPFSGRIISADDDDGGGVGFSVRCTTGGEGGGAEFVAASAGCGLEEAKLFDNMAPSLCTGGASATRSVLDELAVYYPFGGFGGPGDPLLCVQATEFSCGGLVLGVTWNHAVADGVGIAQLLVAVGELARGLPSPSVVPVRSDESVSRLPPLFDPIQETMLMWPEASLEMGTVVALDITIPWSFIDGVKAEYNNSRSSSSSSSPAKATAFEVALAVLWRCRTRAIQADPGIPAHLSLVANLRRHVGASAGYYGNCVANQLLVMATSGAVADAGIVDLVKTIKRAKDQIPDDVLDKSSSSDHRLQMQGLGGRYGFLHVSSWRNIGFEQVDFGTGAPARVMFHHHHGKDPSPPPVPMCVMYPPCKGKDGINVMSASVREEHADAFLAQLASLSSQSHD